MIFMFSGIDASPRLSGITFFREAWPSENLMSMHPKFIFVAIELANVFEVVIEEDVVEEIIFAIAVKPGWYRG